MEKVKRGGGDRDRSPPGRYGRDREMGGGSSRGFGGGGARRGGSVSEFCVKLRGLPWSATKVRS